MTVFIYRLCFGNEKTDGWSGLKERLVLISALNYYNIFKYIHRVNARIPCDDADGLRKFPDTVKNFIIKQLQGWQTLKMTSWK
ncbi:MAG: hypothetical protein CVV64_06215 [Candidatus Wallbacteria bacterium HGW-Wallbacteria-1]|jgi:hypothetical protein|uniref:Uncharacterized protein n=1 Tax=Candidatus Wallbacteria bacterium HGW-Wallbacteria-1 TaxID=2013854 RepID=A0A2N1PSN9_9BACT|nr:MAG: hypothetical protein CVV64_06215 [Candidatus Wallbacteria bacterium HGW-Wallbacteria-1]